jgi:nuclear pore complex protein Nup205
MGLHWTLDLFTELYEGIESGNIPGQLLDNLKEDLENLIIVKKKNEASRKLLEVGKVQFSDGEYELNDEFKIAAATVSDDLDIDELIAAELIHNSSGLGITLIDNAQAAYYLRKKKILNIVSYIFNAGDIPLVELVNSSNFQNTLLESFKFVQDELTSVFQLVQKAKLVGTYNSTEFQLKIKFRRDFLKAQHETLGEILYGLVSKNLVSKTQFLKFFNFIDAFDADDFFAVHLLPGFLLFVSKLSQLPDEDVKQLHSDLIKQLHNKDIYKRPLKVFSILVFSTYFIDWCKSSPQRLKEFDFDIAIETPMTQAIQLGALEEFLIVAAETTDFKSELFYDIRSLLEQHLPRLVQKRIYDINEEETKKLRLQDPQSQTTVYVIDKDDRLSENLTELLTQTLDNFIQSFISDAAFLLVKLKDSEEDSLLSGEDLSLDDISKNADLERFYLALFFVYADRESLISSFWEDRESNSFGFIEWASKSEDLLMRSTFAIMVSALATGSENASHVYHFISISDKINWTEIINILNLYVERIAEFEKNGDDHDLSEEIILSISSYFTLLYQVAANSEVVKGYFDSSLLDVLFRFIKLDIPLIGPALQVISSLVSDNQQRRFNIWERLDSWIFNESPNQIREAFQSKFVTYPDILGFVRLFEILIKSHQSPIGKLDLPYPRNLGYPYRKGGIAPYLDFILGDVFFNSKSLYFAEKVELQEPILKILDHNLSYFDPKLILNSFPAAVDLNSIVSTSDFTTYVQLNPAPITLNYLFQEKIYGTILAIISTGYDNISDKSFNEKQVQIVDLSLKIISDTFDLEVAYIDELLPILKRDNSIYLSTAIGTHGLRSFYDAVLFNLPVVAHIALYIGSSHLPIADKSIKLLSRFASAPQFGANVAGQSVGKTRLLTILDSVNESLRIKHNFINQLESEITSKEVLDVKVQILNFLNSNLSASDRRINVSHFLLGFDLKNGLSLGSEDSDTFIASESSVFKTLLYILESSLLSINSQNIDYAPIRLASLALEIVLKLSRNPLSSSLILNHISNFELLNKLLDVPKVDVHTNWNGEPLNPDLSSATSFNSGPAIGAFLSFLNFRSLILKYFSLELHRTAEQGSISKISKYIDLLTTGNEFSLGPPKVLSFLDVLEFNLSEVPSIPDELEFFGTVDLNLNLNKILLDVSSDGIIFNLEDLDSLLDLHLRQLHVSGLYKTVDEEEKQASKLEEVKSELMRAESFRSTALITLPGVVRNNQNQVLNEKDRIRHRFINYLAGLKFKSYQLSSLHTWDQLIQIIVTDGNLDPVKRSNFILEVFQAIVARIDDYVETDILYAEELVSLSVSLYDIYHQDRKSIEQGSPNNSVGYERLYPLFRSCLNGILSPSSSMSLRSDLYVLSNKYLSGILNYPESSKEILKSIKFSSERLISVVCNDAISGEGPTRITGLLLLESLFQLSSINQLNFVLNTLVKNNLLLLLVKSIKRTDDILTLSYDNKITLDSLLYELTAFKATFSFLIRVAETRKGAQQLLQSEIFQTIKACSFLLIDPDLGLDLMFDKSTVQSSTFVRVNLNLDTPLSFDNASNGVSLFELLVPAFQLVSAILLSTSSENKLVIQQVKNLLKHFRKLIVGVLKRDVLVENKREAGIYKDEGINSSGLKELVNLFVLLSTLTEFNGEE